MPDIQFCLIQGLCMEQESLIFYVQVPPHRQPPMLKIRLVNPTCCLDSLQRFLTSTFLLDQYFLHHTFSSWAISMVTHLLSVSHSLWVSCKHVVHDQRVGGLAHAAVLQVFEELHTQLLLGTKISLIVNGITLKDTLWTPYIEGHSVDSLLCTPLMDCQC